MTREEMIEHRKGLIEVLDRRKQLSDFDVNAATIRNLLETQIAVLDHLIERLRRRA